LTLPETLIGEDLPPSGGLDALLRASLFKLLSQTSRVAASVELARSLREVARALHGHALDEALRILDRAWRCLPTHAGTLSPIYGRLLALEARDHDAALSLLQRAIELTPDPDTAALIALSLLRLQRPVEARRELEAALGEYCIETGGLLSPVAGELMRHPAVGAPGWIGRAAHLELVGELAADEASNVLDISLDGDAAFTQLLRPTPREGARGFRFQLPKARLAATLTVSVRTVPLLGSGTVLSEHFGLDGRGEARGRRVTGWVRLGWRPARSPRLRIEDEHGHRRALSTVRQAQPGWRWPFALDLPGVRAFGDRWVISAQLPDGRWQALPDAPLLLAPAVRLAGPRAPRLPSWSARASRPRLARALSQNTRLTDIIIPVYRGREDSLACIESVLTSLDRTARVIVVDDASEDSQLAAALDALAADGRITLLRNDVNQGFVAAVNRAVALHPAHDVVLLNSDTLVFDDWLARFRAAAYSDASVGTVTPLSNSGTIASYPQPLGAPIDAGQAAALHALASAAHSGIRAVLPVGVGFCLYIRRDCLADVGALDAAVFGKGYGEETDFCLRARRRGWSHRLAADVFVYHAAGVSFGARRSALLERSQRLINLRHPGYDAHIASFLARDPLHPLRRRLDELRLCALDGRLVLLVTLSLAGGVDRFVAERCRVLRAEGLIPLVLRAGKGRSARRCELWTDALSLPNLRYDIPAELDALTALLTALPLQAIEIQHFLHLDARVIEAVRALPLPYDVYVHDYAWICPRVTLIDGSGRYCGEPAVSVCQVCVRRNGSNLGEAISVPALRSRSERWLRSARRVIAPSADTAARLQRHFPDLAVAVRPHAPTVPPAARPPRPADRRVIRVALLGGIGDHKGYRVLLACARDARARRLPIEFVVIGYTHKDAPLLATGKVFITGPYSEVEAPHLIRRERPDIAWLPSVWPETWCYTLDYALEAGLPVAAFDLGAIAERLRALATGVLLPLGMAPRHVNDRLLELAQPAERPTAPKARFVQKAPPSARDGAKMRQSAEITMPKAAAGKAEEKVKAEEQGVSASVQALPLPAGLYLFSVKAAMPVIARSTGLLSLPAVHVGLGPGVPSGQVEFIAGPSTQGAWLFAQGDLLVTKVNGTGATLIVTSMRAPGGEVLAIKVERLEARAEAIASAQAPTTAPPAKPAAPPRAEPRAQKASARGAAGKPAAAVDAAAPDQPLPLQIGAHIRTRGDMSFADLPWAGRVGPGLWIESFSVRPLQKFTAQEIEYKGLTGSGFETPWLSDDKMCGTRGMAVPLVGFAVRLKPSPAAAYYDCEYSGYFQSGLTVGPLKNGAPCRSTVANDPLEGIQVRIVRRQLAAPPPVLQAPARSAPATKPASHKPAPHKPVPHKPAAHKRKRAAKASSAAHARKANGAGKPAASAKHPGAAHRTPAPLARPGSHLIRRSARQVRRPSQRRP
jgi:GT2 family glycosyltransferase